MYVLTSYILISSLHVVSHWDQHWELKSPYKKRILLSLRMGKKFNPIRHFNCIWNQLKKLNTNLIFNVSLNEILKTRWDQKIIFNVLLTLRYLLNKQYLLSKPVDKIIKIIKHTVVNNSWKDGNINICTDISHTFTYH